MHREIHESQCVSVFALPPATAYELFTSDPLSKVAQGFGFCFRHFNNWDERGPRASQKAVGALHLRSAGEI